VSPVAAEVCNPIFRLIWVSGSAIIESRFLIFRQWNADKDR
jgi:hypothetical protein